MGNQFKCSDIYFRQKVNNNGYSNEDLYTNRLLDKLCKNNIFLEQLRVANKALYNTLIKYQNNVYLSQKEHRHLLESITNYYIRSMSRNTPFGLFSGVGNLYGKEYKAGKAVNISFQWLYEIIMDMVKRHPGKFKYVINNNLKTLDNNIYFLDYGNYDYKKKSEGFKIKRNRLIELIEDLCKEPVSFMMIIKTIGKEYSDVSTAFIQKYIINLVCKKILIPSILPSLDEDKIVILNKIKNIAYELGENNISSEILEIEKLVTEYENTKIGEGISSFERLEDSMSKIRTVNKDDLSVNFYIKNPTIVPSRKDISNIEELINRLCSISEPCNLLENYTFNFIDKFGTETEVPLNVLINPNQGIGYPKKDDINISKELQQELNRYWSQKIDNALLNDMPLILNNKIFEEVKNIKKRYGFDKDLKLPNSTDICLTISNNYKNDLHDLYISEILGSNRGYSMIGRFRRLDNYKVEQVFSILYKEYELCDINALPVLQSTTNLITNKHYSNSELSIGLCSNRSKRSILLSDLLIGYDTRLNVLYIKSRKKEKRILFLDNNMLNEEFKNPLIQLLISISCQSLYKWYEYSWNMTSSERSVKPEIRYKNIVVSPKIWSFYFNISDTFEKFKNDFISFSHQYKMPDVFYFVDNDNKILSSINSNSLYTIYKIAQKNRINLLKFENIEKNKLNMSYKDEEIVTTLIKSGSQYVNLNKKEYQVISPNNSSSNWIYFNIVFGSYEWKQHFLENHLDNLLTDQTKNIKCVFFIQYETPNNFPTIRLRYKAKDCLNVQKELIEYLDKLIISGEIKDYSIDNYYPEIYRYTTGNIKDMTIIEKIFSYDSVIIQKIRQTESSKSNFLLSCFTYIIGCFDNFHDSLEFLKQNCKMDKLSKTEKEWLRKNQGILNRKNLLINSELKTLINSRTNELMQLICDRKYNDSYLYNLLGSLLHMTCNRYLGTNRNKENTYMILLYKLVNSLSYQSDDSLFKSKILK